MAGSGRFIAFEGPEGAGKSLQIDRLSRRLADLGVPHVTTREPGGTVLAEAIRELILDRPDVELDGLTELLLFTAARRAHVDEVIRPALERGEIVLCDRFELSTRAYQGYGRGVPQETIVRLTAEATDGTLPDLYLLLDVPPSVGRGRQGGAAPDRIEREGTDFMERVRAGYAALASSDPSVEAVDASGPPDQVEAEIAAILERRFPGLFRDASGETFAGGPGLRH